MNMRINNNFKHELKKLEEKIERIGGERNIPITDLLTEEFLSRFTNFSSIDDMFNKSGFIIESKEDFEKVPDEEWDIFIGQNTQYETWQELLNAAGQVWFAAQFNAE